MKVVETQDLKVNRTVRKGDGVDFLLSLSETEPSPCTGSVYPIVYREGRD